jgi:hypothetical protein
MRQQVNLLQPVLRPEPKPFSARFIAGVLGAVALVLCLIHGYDRWRVSALQRDMDRLATATAAAAAQRPALEARYPARVKDAAMELEAAGLAREVLAKERLLAALTDSEFGNTRGFSAQLEALARQHLDGTWLTGFTIADGGRALALAGRALAPELVPALLQRLGREPALAGRAFSALAITRAEDEPELVAFNLATPGTWASGIAADGR